MKAARATGLILCASLAVAACRSGFVGDSSVDPPGRVSMVTDFHGQLEIRWDSVPSASGYRIVVRLFDGQELVNDIGLGQANQTTINYFYGPGVQTVEMRTRAGGRLGPPTFPMETTFTNVPLGASPMWSASDAVPGEGFGAAVAAGDFDHDGWRDLAVGAPLAKNTSGVAAGRVYLYRGNASGLETTPWASLEGGTVGERFGAALDAADVGGDGYDDLLVGAPGRTNGQGRIQLFPGSPVGLVAVPATTIDDTVPSAHFGAAVVFTHAGGSPNALVGAPGDAATNGRVRFIPSQTGGLVLPPLWSTTGATPGDGFGSAIAFLAGDRFVAGVPYHVPTAVLGSAGRVEVRSLADGSLLYGEDGTLSNGHLGYSVASGELGGDGLGDFVAGEPDAKTAAEPFTTGHVRAWYATGGGWSESYAGGVDAGERLGYSVTVASGLYAPGNAVIAGAPLRGASGAALLDPGNRVLALDQDWVQDIAPSGTLVRAVGDLTGDSSDEVAVSDPDGGRGRVAIYASRSVFGPQANSGIPQTVGTQAEVHPLGASIADVHPPRAGYRCTWTWDDDPVPQVVVPCSPDDPAPAAQVHHVFTGPGDHWVRLHVELPQNGYTGESVTRIRVR